MIGFIKQDFVKKGGANQNFCHKEGGLEQKGGIGQKEGGDFFKEAGHTLVPTMS